VAAAADVLFTRFYHDVTPSPNWINLDRPSYWVYDPWMDPNHYALGGPRKTVAKLVANECVLEAVLTGRINNPHVTISALNYAGTPGVEWPDDEYEHIKGEPDSRVIRLDDAILVIRNNRQTRVSLFDPFDVDLDAMDDAGGAAIKSPMHGKLVALMVQAGDAVTKGQKLAIVEAMKMEHALVAPRDGVVAEVIGDIGAQVGEGARVVVLAEG
jgi:3-methylcrotonyl-CoA carboxylase alpha subunit